MKRYGIFPITGNGTFQTPYRPTVANVAQANYNSLIPTNPQGHPVYGFAFCIVGVIGLDAVQTLTNSFIFPDYPLDGQMGSMEPATRNGMNQSVEAYNLDGQGLHLDMDFYADTDSYRAVIDGAGDQFEPVFNVNSFDVAEPEA